MPPVFTRMLAERLDRHSARLGGRGLGRGRGRARARLPRPRWPPHGAVRHAAGTSPSCSTTGPPENFCRPAADVLFRAAVDVYGADVLAVVLTGMGRDGLRGAEAVRGAGGSVIAQSEESCTVASMPAAVAAAGLARRRRPAPRSRRSARAARVPGPLTWPSRTPTFSSSANSSGTTARSPWPTARSTWWRAGWPRWPSARASSPSPSWCNECAPARRACAGTSSRPSPRTRSLFFRDLHPFEALRQVIIPAALDRRAPVVA